jgi:hypothetical protein
MLTTGTSTYQSTLTTQVAGHPDDCLVLGRWLVVQMEERTTGQPPVAQRQLQQPGKRAGYLLEPLAAEPAATTRRQPARARSNRDVSRG